MTNTWKQYEAGRDYKNRIGFLERGRQNERFYRGDQWKGVGGDLPKPVFNVVRRVVDYLVCTVASDRYEVSYTDEDLPFLAGADAAAVQGALAVMNEHLLYRWDKCRMDDLVYALLQDAAIYGDALAYCYWDKSATAGGYGGDIAVQAVDAASVFAADMNKPDIQSQDYIILAGRARVSALRAEALAAGVSEGEAGRILPDDAATFGASDGARTELADGEDGKATYLVKFYREDGHVVYEKSTKDCVICRTVTGCRLYPVAHLCWSRMKNAFHGQSPISEMIPNQKFINKAYGMVMKHMTDTAFSKVLYDKSRIPEWSNEVGEAIAVVGAVNVADAVSVVGTGQMQSGYLDLIASAVSTTKELMGATETALGNAVPSNTSAILALREASKISLGQVESALCVCIADIADILADMMCAYYEPHRLLPTAAGARSADLERLKKCILRARVVVREAAQYSASALMTLLDKLLEGGHIDLDAYMASLPEGVFPTRVLAGKEVSAHE